MGIDLPLPAIRGQIASGIDIIVHLGRLRDRTRKVLEITEVLPVINGEIQTRTLYRFNEKGEENGIIIGSLEKSNELSNKGKLITAGLL